MNKPKVLFIGVGAITTPIVTALKGNADIYLLARKSGDTYGPLTEKGIRVTYNPEAGSRKDPATRPPEVTMENGKDYTVVSDLSELNGDPPDYIFLGLGAPALTKALFDKLKANNLLGKKTRVLPVANGVPIWFGKTPEAKAAGIRYVHAVDPNGDIISNYGDWIDACFSAAAARPRPKEAGGEGRQGDIEVRGDFPLFIGPAEGGEASPELTLLADLIKKGGGNVKLSKDMIFDAVVKMTGNAVFNAMATWLDMSLQKISTTPETAAIALEIMGEVKNVFETLGVKREGKPLELQPRLDAVKTLTHKTSMKADFDKGNEPEIRALMIAITEIGDHVGVKTPKLRALIRIMEELAVQKTPYVAGPTRFGVTPAGDIARAYHGFQRRRLALAA